MPSTRTELRQSDWQSTLFDDCALPGCAVPVVVPGDVCQSCRVAFGDMLNVRTEGPAREPAQVRADLAARDASTREQYRAQAATVAAAQQVSSRKRNQICWLCEERRTCTSTGGRWECADCQSLPS
ncbi:hypothetical protein CH306_26385 [Rhodococcus sp. 15-725-2-2b]|uniref:hypothetical protein n=1 Tax=unclassified Rhodococcus (in: high G+C Gram-positive bacteria) TaxID=192944 RepID=UPI000B9AA74F|nr:MULTISPECIES: hypothetical protein [unclassified Rhodococcus (in: high G+C Gram-positive bacteria)]OZC63588.1 hypothetical protein CH277_22275 [Rhodococcus sp. 06-469-3-2]OZD40753.1 hypothetical protein CH264_23960 [Rhodococcus sp. 06-1477-1A]OZE67139.1 hypothetical protein CH306_26385 [Rhodococcus sp. 15-725-2-2b]